MSQSPIFERELAVDSFTFEGLDTSYISGTFDPLHPAVENLNGPQVKCNPGEEYVKDVYPQYDCDHDFVSGETKSMRNKELHAKATHPCVEHAIGRSQDTTLVTGLNQESDGEHTMTINTSATAIEVIPDLLEDTTVLKEGSHFHLDHLDSPRLSFEGCFRGIDAGSSFTLEKKNISEQKFGDKATVPVNENNKTITKEDSTSNNWVEGEDFFKTTFLQPSFPKPSVEINFHGIDAGSSFTLEKKTINEQKFGDKVTMVVNENNKTITKEDSINNELLEDDDSFEIMFLRPPYPQGPPEEENSLDVQEENKFKHQTDGPVSETGGPPMTTVDIFAVNEFGNHKIAHESNRAKNSNMDKIKQNTGATVKHNRVKTKVPAKSHGKLHLTDIIGTEANSSSNNIDARQFEGNAPRPLKVRTRSCRKPWFGDLINDLPLPLCDEVQEGKGNDDNTNEDNKNDSKRPKVRAKASTRSHRKPWFEDLINDLPLPSCDNVQRKGSSNDDNFKTKEDHKSTPKPCKAITKASKRLHRKAWFEDLINDLPLPSCDDVQEGKYIGDNTSQNNKNDSKCSKVRAKAPTRSHRKPWFEDLINDLPLPYCDDVQRKGGIIGDNFKTKEDNKSTIKPCKARTKASKRLHRKAWFEDLINDLPLPSFDDYPGKDDSTHDEPKRNSGNSSCMGTSTLIGEKRKRKRAVV